MRILLVEDDLSLGDGVRAGLAQSGFAIDWVRDGDAAISALSAESFSAIVLDLGLPRRDGLTVLGWLRARGDTTPVLILTARDGVENRVRGLDAGADDYVLKPFDIDEVAARLRALIRRASGQAQPLLKLDGLELDPASRRVTQGGEEVALTAREFDLLHALMRHSGQVQTRRALEEALYTWENELESNALEVHIHHLRKKLGADRIRTVRGVGYVAA